MSYLIGAMIAAAALVGALWFRRAHQDEVFDGLPPGTMPVAGEPAPRRTLTRGEKPIVAVRFAPPDGVGPGLAGVAIDTQVDPVELSATLVDLAARGWLRLRPLRRREGDKPSDWALERRDPAPAGDLTAWERELLASAFGTAPTITMSELRARPGLSRASDALAAEVGRRRWLRPRSLAPRWAAGVLVAAGILSLIGGHLPIALGALVGAGLVYGLAGRLATPRTAEGSAVRAQCEGFKLYLATAEADRLRFEVGVDTFGRYLPYAMVFGVVDHWRSVFAEALRDNPELYEDGLGWLVLDNMVDAAILLDLLSGSGILDSLVTDFADFDIPELDGIGDTVGGVIEGIGDFFD